MRIALSADHRGHELGGVLAERLREDGHEVLDLRPAVVDPQDDYPDRARETGEAVRDGRAERGIVVCGSGVGACIAANKIRSVRASVCQDTYTARQGVEHDEMNVLCLGSVTTNEKTALAIVSAFVAARFFEEEKYVRRLKKVMMMEAEWRRPNSE